MGMGGETVRGRVRVGTVAWLAVVGAVAAVTMAMVGAGDDPGAGGPAASAPSAGGPAISAASASPASPASPAPQPSGARPSASAGTTAAGATPSTSPLPEIALPPALAALPAACGHDAQGFAAWVRHFRSAAAGDGLSPATLRSLDGLSYAHQVISLDRHQRHFRKTFEEFGRPRIAQRIDKARRMQQQHARLLQSIEREFGVPAGVIIAIWALETDFGTVMGRQPALRSIATLAYDCRRSARFTAELHDALQLIERGDLSAREMKGAWAGELGQTQFLASSYLKYGIDFDRDGKRDLITSVPDVLASTANYLRGHGWQAGAPLEEGSANAQVLRAWNRSSVYQKTIIEFARQLREGHPHVDAQRGSTGAGRTSGAG